MGIMEMLEGNKEDHETHKRKLAEETARDYQRHQEEAKSKIYQVNRWLESNASHGARAMVEKFNLAWSHEKDYGNGVCVIGFYTDETLRFKVCEIHDESKKWLR